MSTSVLPRQQCFANAPITIRESVKRLSPLRVPVGVRWKGLGCQSVMTLIGCFGAVIFVMEHHASPFEQRMIGLETEMCLRGRRNFVANRNVDIGWVVVSDTI